MITPTLTFTKLFICLVTGMVIGAATLKIAINRARARALARPPTHTRIPYTAEYTIAQRCQSCGQDL